MTKSAAAIPDESQATESLDASLRAVGDRLEAIRTKPKRATLALMLHAGGDHRIWPDPISGRNRYGTKSVPAPNEISFASTTASTISPMSFEAVGHTYSRLFEVGYGTGLTLPSWFADLRARIVASLARSDDEAILAASGTDAAIIALALARRLTERPITAIYFAPDETGAGIPRATRGQHFSDMTALGAMVTAGAPIAGIGEDIDVEMVPLRSETSSLRSEADVDADVEARISQALKSGRDVVLTVLDTAKTGIGSMSRAKAKEFADASQGRVHVIVDACQLRCSRSTIAADLERGFFVTVTGSKYLAGPAFCGAVLVPKATAETLGALPTRMSGLADYSAALDWPLALRHILGSDIKAEANLGLGFRWTAALEHLDHLIQIDEATEAAILKRFAGIARELARYSLTASLQIADFQQERASETILPIAVTEPSGRLLDADAAAELHARLREDETTGPICHLGQPVKLETGAVLRIAASAVDVLDTAKRLDEGLTLDAALEPVRRRLETVFEKWNRLLLNDR